MSKSVFTFDKENLEVRVERIYNATPERIYEAYTTPEQIAQWWGPAQYKTTVDQMDVRVGGTWRFVHTGDDGQTAGFHGEYKELDPPHKIVDTFEYEGMPGHVLVETTTFEPLPDGTTKLTTVSKYDNLQDLEGMISTGMEAGLTESQDRLEKLLAA
jgi:uncharacterized protein YndB with AHSA1/START domain